METIQRIILPEDETTRRGLESKLAEYLAIMDELTAQPIRTPELGRVFADAGCRALIAQKLLLNGEIDTAKLLQEIKRRHGGPVDESLYYEAVRVIDDYCRTGGRNVGNGTNFIFH